jgi:hypothetical protein
MDYIKKRVLELISRNENLDSVDILYHFRMLNSDHVLEALFELEKDKIVKREYSGIRTKYVVLNHKEIILNSI